MRVGRNGNWNSNDKWQQLQKRAHTAPKNAANYWHEEYENKKNCNGKWKGAWRVGKNRETRQIAQSVKLKQTKK